MRITHPSDSELIHSRSTIVDMHAHPSLKTSIFHRALTSKIYPSRRAFDPFSFRTDYKSLHDGGVDVVLSALYAPERGLLRECPPLRLMRYLRPFTWKKIYGVPYFSVMMELIDQIEKAISTALDPDTDKPLMRVARSYQELEAILSQSNGRQIAFVHCIEGSHCLDGELANLDLLAGRGVSYIGLAHFFKNQAVHPCYPWPESIQKLGMFQAGRDISLGLTAFGEDVVQRMMELGMLIDVSHSTPPARRRIFDIVQKKAPMIASHVGAFEVNPDPYNLKDSEIRKIADSGGVVSVIFMNFWLMPHETHRGLNFIMRTIDHFINIAGEEGVSIGTDFDGFTDPPDDIKDASELPKLTQYMLAAGYSEKRIAKIWGGNALRVLREGWGRRT